MERARLVPVAGRLVIDPETRRVVPPEGVDVAISTYWVRRLRCGDVTVAPPLAVVVPQISDSSEETDP